MKSMQEIERRLIAEFTVEVMTGSSIDVQELPGYSDDFNVQMMQDQYAPLVHCFKETVAC